MSKRSRVVLHAPDPVPFQSPKSAEGARWFDASLPACSTALSSCYGNIAKKGETVTCRKCLALLKKRPQYMNRLFTEAGIDGRGWKWRKDDASSESEG